MTRIGKCDTCRMRKIKCDEKRPICDACGARGRPCSYSYGKPHAIVHERLELDKTNKKLFKSRSSTWDPFEDISMTLSCSRSKPQQSSPSGLQLKMSRHADRGTGTFYVFDSGSQRDMLERRLLKHSRAKQRSSPMSPLSSREMKIAARWAYMVGSRSQDIHGLQLLGDWVTMVPTRLGSSHIVDLAAIYMLESCVAYLRKTDEGKDQARLFGTNALQSLRVAFSQDPLEKNIRDLILAVRLHLHAEVIWFGWAHSAKMSSRASSEVAGYAFIENGIRLPRLLRYVRDWCSDPSDERAFEAMDLAGALYLNDLGLWIEDVTQEFVELVPTSSEEWSPYVPQSYEFASKDVFNIFLQYNTLRVLLFGLIQTLYSGISLDCPFDFPAIEAQDVEAGAALVMCIQYATRYQATIPLATQKLILPLQVAIGAFHRLSKREGTSQSLEYWYAEGMKQKLVDYTNAINTTWNCAKLPASALEDASEALAGGPRSSWMGNPVAWSSMWEVLGMRMDQTN